MRYWPFLTGRARRAGHRVVARPDLLTADQAQQLLGPLPAPAGGGRSEPGEILRRVVRDSPVGPVTVFYRVVEATAENYGVAGDGALHDQYGRSILVTEGIVVRGVREDVSRGDLGAAIHEAHASVVPAFQDFWAQNEEFTTSSVTARKAASSGTGDQATVRIVDVAEPEVAAVRAVRPGARRNSGKAWLVRLVIVLTGLAAGVAGWKLWPEYCGGPFSGFRLNDETNLECIGITDGSYLFNDPGGAVNDTDRAVIERINEVQRRIAAENDAVASGDRYVKVVLLMPLTVSQSKPSAVSLPQILHSLEGSYTGLMRANKTAAFGDPSVMRLQLLLANQGSQQEGGAGFVNDILEKSQPDHPVVAVVGLGVSRPETKTIAEELQRHSIPMVSAVTSADVFTDLPGFWSVSPSSTDYVRTLRRFLDDQSRLKSGIIVYDQNEDLYVRSLAAAYRAELGPRYVKHPDQGFRGSTIDSPVAENIFDPMVRNFCNATSNPDGPLDMVFYAGRVVDFDEFARALDSRSCADRPLTVLVGSAGFTSASDYRDVLRRSNVTLIYTSATDSSAWGRNAAGTPPGYRDFLAAYHDYVAPKDSGLADGYAIAHHDAFVTAARAIRLAASVDPGQVPEPANVATDGFSHLNLGYEIPAASGTLSFPPEGGRATGLLITIEQVK